MYINQLRAKERKLKGWTTNSPSLTVPDQSLTIRQIIERYQRGEEMNIAHPCHYDDDETFETDPTAMGQNFDLADFTAMQKEINERSLQRERDAARKKQEDAEMAAQAGSAADGEE